MKSKQTVFISYNKEDTAIALEIAIHLNASGVDVHLDKWEVPPGKSFIEWMEKGIEDSTFFILIWSENAESSFWVQKERRSFLERMRDNENLEIIPIRTDDTKLPPLINDINAPRFTKDNIDDFIKDLLWGITGERPVELPREKLLRLQKELTDAVKTGDPFPYVLCPNCGSDKLKKTGDSDPDGRYEVAIIKCETCGFTDWTEI